MRIASDWTTGPAKWGAALLISAASISGIAWSLSGNRKPVVVIHATDAKTVQAAPAREPVPPATFRSESTPPAAAAPAGNHLINLNTATQAELELLPGIGPAMAKRILEYRTTHGKFTAIDQLDGVKGIGEKTMAKLRPMVCVD